MQDDPRATVTEKATEHPLIGIMRVIRLKSIMGRISGSDGRQRLG